MATTGPRRNITGLKKEWPIFRGIEVKADGVQMLICVPVLAIPVNSNQVENYANTQPPHPIFVTRFSSCFSVGTVRDLEACNTNNIEVSTTFPNLLRSMCDGILDQNDDLVKFTPGVILQRLANGFKLRLAPENLKRYNRVGHNKFFARMAVEKQDLNYMSISSDFLEKQIHYSAWSKDVMCDTSKRSAHDVSRESRENASTQKLENSHHSRQMSGGILIVVDKQTGNCPTFGRLNPPLGTNCSPNTVDEHKPLFNPLITQVESIPSFDGASHSVKEERAECCPYSSTDKGAESQSISTSQMQSYQSPVSPNGEYLMNSNHKENTHNNHQSTSRGVSSPNTEYQERRPPSATRVEGAQALSSESTRCVVSAAPSTEYQQSSLSQSEDTRKSVRIALKRKRTSKDPSTNPLKMPKLRKLEPQPPKAVQLSEIERPAYFPPPTTNAGLLQMFPCAQHPPHSRGLASVHHGGSHPIVAAAYPASTMITPTAAPWGPGIPPPPQLLPIEALQPQPPPGLVMASVKAESGPQPPEGSMLLGDPAIMRSGRPFLLMSGSGQPGEGPVNMGLYQLETIEHPATGAGQQGIYISGANGMLTSTTNSMPAYMSGAPASRPPSTSRYQESACHLAGQSTSASASQANHPQISFVNQGHGRHFGRSPVAVQIRNNSTEISSPSLATSNVSPMPWSVSKKTEPYYGRNVTGQLITNSNLTSSSARKIQQTFSRNSAHSQRSLAGSPFYGNAVIFDPSTSSIQCYDLPPSEASDKPLNMSMTYPATSCGRATPSTDAVSVTSATSNPNVAFIPRMIGQPMVQYEQLHQHQQEQQKVPRAAKRRSAEDGSTSRGVTPAPPEGGDGLPTLMSASRSSVRSSSSLGSSSRMVEEFDILDDFRSEIVTPPPQPPAAPRGTPNVSCAPAAAAPSTEEERRAKIERLKAALKEKLSLLESL